VSWSGTDGAGSSGVAAYDVYVSTDAGPYALWQEHATATQATFSGAHGHSYAFYSVASDGVGHIEAAPPSADAQINLVLPPWLQPSVGASYTLSDTAFAISGGTATLTGDAATTHPNLTLSAALPGTLVIGAIQHLAGLSIAAGGTASVTAGAQAVVIVNTLQLAAGAKIDLADNDMIIDYTGASPIADIEAMVGSGYNVIGDWLGTGLTSSIAALDGNFTLAVADNAQLPAPFGASQGGPPFSGIDVDLTTVLVKFTHRTDVDLDGLITPNDASIFGTNFSENDFANWAMGDMDYDGLFTLNDASIFGTFYDESLPQV
jgi:hypothetical protein